MDFVFKYKRTWFRVLVKDNFIWRKGIRKGFQGHEAHKNPEQIEIISI